MEGSSDIDKESNLPKMSYDIDKSPVEESVVENAEESEPKEEYRKHMQHLYIYIS